MAGYAAVCGQAPGDELLGSGGELIKVNTGQQAKFLRGCGENLNLRVTRAAAHAPKRAVHHDRPARQRGKRVRHRQGEIVVTVKADRYS